MAQNDRNEAEEYLKQKRMDVSDALKTLLGELGIKYVHQLKYIKEGDCDKYGLPPIFWRELSDICSTLPTQDPPAQVSAPLPLTMNYSRPIGTAKPKLMIKYTLCNELFTSPTKEQCLMTLDPETDAMEIFVKCVRDRDKIPDSLQLEIFSDNGCPLNVNPYTMKLTLKQWNFRNNDAFYIFLRRKDQLAWSMEEVTAQDVLDPNGGSSPVHVICQVFGTFTVHFNPVGDDITVLKKKVAKCINVPPKSFEIHQKIGDHQFFTTLRALKANDTVIVRLKPTELLHNYGKSSYIPLVEQTEKGLAKFYSILRYLTQSDDVNHLAIVAVVKKMTGCLPIVTALHHLFHHKTFAHISYLVALFEGFYFLSRAILEYFCQGVNLNETFEFCDYIFGLILKEAETCADDVESKTVNLSCPITGRILIQPVYITAEGGVLYERLAVMEKIKNRERIPECSQTDVSEHDLFYDESFGRNLIANSFSPNREIVCAEGIGSMNIPPLEIPFTWKDIYENVSHLKVFSPDCEVLDTKARLTYIQNGHFAVFIGTTKGSEQVKVVYNSIKCEEESYTENDMKTFVCSDKSLVTRNIANLFNPKVKQAMPGNSLPHHTNFVIQERRKIGDISREPEEAIMVLIDTSSSMLTKIDDQQPASPDVQQRPNPQTVGYTRLRAAQDYFNAFANRTQAYQYHHVVGVIYFSTDITVALPLCEALEHFKSVLQSTSVTSGQTALYNAIKKATEILSDFNHRYPMCINRILCLTDGEDNASTVTASEVIKILQREDIILDTVLITGSTGYLTQRMMTHATGGLCFLPANVSEGMRLFEMEILLSSRQRKKAEDKIDFTTNEGQAELKSKKYDSCDPFSYKNQMFIDLQKTSTCSAQRMVLLASFAMYDHQTSGQQPNKKRVLTEMNKYIKNPHEDIEIFPDETNVCDWKILLRGPKGTPYQDGVYLLFAKFPENYPYKPPSIRFVTPIYHCNINSMGRICHPILGRNYIPSLSMRDVLNQVYGLLMAPEPEDPLDSVLADEYHTNKDEYLRKAYELNRQHACNITWQDYKKILTEDDADVELGITCPLTGKIYVEPVSTPDGHVFEHAALLDFIARKGTDPASGKPLTVNDLRPDKATKLLVEKFRKTNIY